jgi:hypothetical protein
LPAEIFERAEGDNTPNLNYHELTRWAEERSPDLRFECKLEALHPVRAAIVLNINRLLAMAVLPNRLIVQSRRLEAANRFALFKLFKRPWAEPGDDLTQVDAEMERILPTIDFRSSDPDESSLMFAARTIEATTRLHNVPYIGAETLLASTVTGGWTAIESFLGDLWEVALNLHPADLCLLDGKADRIQNKAGTGIEKYDRAQGGVASTSNNEKAGASITLKQIQDLTRKRFDLSDRMGTVLKNRFSFQKLVTTREAYSRAFHEKRRADEIDAALSNPAIDALNLVRNVLVHSAGIADEKYCDRLNNVLLAPKAQLGEKIPLTADNVVCMLHPAFKACSELLSAVDRWIRNHPAKEGREAAPS